MFIINFVMPKRSAKKKALKQNEETASLNYINDKINSGEFMPCLGGCGGILSKYKGCNYIKCIICKIKICWNCRKIKGFASPNTCSWKNPICNSH